MNSEPQRISARAAEAETTDQFAVKDYLRCQKCKKIAVNCYQTEHGCRLCVHCAANWQLRRETAKNCPCGERKLEISNENLLGRRHFYPDTGTRREVNRMEVRCPNRNLGCSHTCARRYLDNHLAECNFGFIKCVLCQQKLPLHLLESHRQKIHQQQNLLFESASIDAKVTPSDDDSSSLNKALRMYLTGDDCQQILLSMFARNPERISYILQSEGHKENNQEDRVRSLLVLVDGRIPDCGENPEHCCPPMPELRNTEEPVSVADGSRLPDQDGASQILLRRHPFKSRSSIVRERKSAPPKIFEFEGIQL